jgi:hypothetical protein
MRFSPWWRVADGGQLVIRPQPWRQLPTAMVLVLFNAVTAWVWIIDVRPGKGAGFSAVLILIWVIYIAESAWGRLVVDPDRVRMISARRDPAILREQIFYIRARRWNTVFYNFDKKPILEMRADLSPAQLLILANELGVNVWDHRAWHGLRKLEHGVRLNPEPFPGRPPG